MKYLTSFSLRDAFSAGVAVGIAVGVDYYFSASKEGWVFLAAFLMSASAREVPLRQIGIFAFNIVMAILLSAFLCLIFKQSAVIDVVVAVFFVITASLIWLYRPLTNKALYLFSLFFLSFLIAVLWKASPATMMQGRIIDVAIGTLIAACCKLSIGRISLQAAFRQGVSRALQALADCSEVMANDFMTLTDHDRLTQKIKVMEGTLQLQPGSYPEWVFDVGFNPGLRSGWRFFLVNLEYMTEIFFSMHYLASQSIDMLMKQEINPFIVKAMQKNQALLEILIEYFKQQTLKDVQADFTSDMTDLENALQRIVPPTMELLDISTDYLTLTAWVRDIKDLRGLLLQLVMSLPVKPVS